MSTDTQQTEQHTHHFILTVQKPIPGGAGLNTFTGNFTATPGMTRRAAYDAICAEHGRVNPHLVDANVMFFALEPNQL